MWQYTNTDIFVRVSIISIGDYCCVNIILNLQDNILLPVKHKQLLTAVQPRFISGQYGQKLISLGTEINKIGQDTLFPDLTEFCIVAFMKEWLRIGQNEIKET